MEEANKKNKIQITRLLRESSLRIQKMKVKPRENQENLCFVTIEYERKLGNKHKPSQTDNFVAD